MTASGPEPDRVAHGTVVHQVGEGDVRVTVVVKVTYALRAGGLAVIAPPQPLAEDLHAGGAWDLAPEKLRADVVVIGRVRPEAPGATRQVVGFAIARGPDVLLQKRIVAFGDRSRFDADPAPIGDLPVAWERTWGGPSSRENPVGTGLSELDARPPNLVDPDAPRRPAGLGPIAPSWPLRASHLPPDHAAALAARPLVLPDDLDLRFFQIAPSDQQIPRLLGGEQILLVGLDPRGAVIHRLPALHAFARLERARTAGIRDVPLAGDTLWIDVDRGLASVTFRGSVEVAKARDAARVLAAREPWIVRAGLSPCKNVEESMGAPRAWSMPTGAGVEDEGPPLPPSPTVDPIRVDDESGFVAACLQWSFDPPKMRRIVIVKGTFTIPEEGGALVPADEQDPLRADEPAPDDAGGELLHASDLAPFKARTDVLLRGTAHAAKGRTTAVVELSVGPVSARLVAIGPRGWDKNGIPEPPGPFEPVPLRWKHAFGGPGVGANPSGTGLAPGTPPPLLEDPERLIRTRGDRPRPAAFAPIAPAWPARSALLGSFDRAWQRERWPYFPANFDPAYFQVAPAALRCDHLRGDEPFRVASVRPGGGDIEGALPGVRARAFAVRRGGDPFEVLLRLDTVLVDADAGDVKLTWRGSFDAENEANSVDRVVVLSERLDAPRTTADVLAHLAASGEQRLSKHRDDLEKPDDGRSKPVVADPVRLGERLHAASAALAAGSALAGGLFAAKAAGSIAAPPAAPPPLRREQVEALVRDGKGLAGRDLSDADLRGIDLSKQPMEGAILARAKLSGARLSGAKLAGAILTDADAPGSAWDGADLTKADLTGANLSGANFEGARLDKAALAGADLSDARLGEASAKGADFSRANLARCRAAKADLTKADLTGARLPSADLRGARLDDAKLDGVIAPGITLDDASLTDARFERARLPGAGMRGVSAVGCAWECADLSGVVLRGDVSGAIFSGALLARADLTGILARGASFRGASLASALLDGADLMQANFEGADLRSASLKGASLFQAETHGANLEGADLSSALLQGTRLAR